MSASPSASVHIGGNGERFRRDELVVGLPYDRLVQDRLRDWGAKPEVKEGDRDPRLGLALMHLDARAAAAHLEHLSEQSASEGGDTPPSHWVSDVIARVEAERGQLNDLDLVCGALRRSFADEHGGWFPTFGKNRVMERLGGSYVIDGGSRKGKGTKVGPAHVIDGGNSRSGPAATRKKLPQRSRTPGAGVRVGLVDTRLAPHPWLAGGYFASADDLLPARPSSSSGKAQHATFVTGLILAEAPGAEVVVRRGLDDEATADTWSVARIVADLADGSVDVVNLSFGCYTEDNQAPLVLSAALAALGRRTVVVAAAGNHGDADETTAPRPCWPAALDNVIAVGAVDGTERAEFSPDAPWVDVLAPGVDRLSTIAPDGDNGPVFGEWSGTSFAAALVSGTIAASTDAAGSARAAWEALHADAVKGCRQGQPPTIRPRSQGRPSDAKAEVRP